MIFLIGIEKNHPKISMEVQKAPSRQTNPEQIAMLLKKMLQVSQYLSLNAI
jgi:hypothetical protein